MFFNDFKDEGKCFTVTWCHIFLERLPEDFLVSGSPFFFVYLIVHSSPSSGDLYQLSKRGVFRRQSLQLCAGAWGNNVKILVAPEGTRAIKVQSPCTLQRCLHWGGRCQGDWLFPSFSLLIFRACHRVEVWEVSGFRGKDWGPGWFGFQALGKWNLSGNPDSNPKPPGPKSPNHGGILRWKLACYPPKKARQESTFFGDLGKNTKREQKSWQVY